MSKKFSIECAIGVRRQTLPPAFFFQALIRHARYAHMRRPSFENEWMPLLLPAHGTLFCQMSSYPE